MSNINPYETAINSKKPRPKFLYKAGAYRSSYTVANAVKCLPFFRAAASNLKDTFIRYELIGGNVPKTWVQKLNDGLLFLVHESLQEWDEIPRDIETNVYWMKFRMSVKFRPETEERIGVWIIFKDRLFSNSINTGTINSPVISDPGALSQDEIKDILARDNNGAVSTPSEKEVEVEVHTLQSDWQKKVVEFIMGENNERTLILSELKLSPEDIIWIHDRVGDLAIDKLIRTDTIRLLRR